MRLSILISLLPIAVVPAPPADGSLGNPAPEIRAAEWFNGSAVNRFEPGKVYVLEFWATWCGYCIQAMPHLSELSAKYGDKAVFLGINVMERPPKTADAEVWKNAAVTKFLASDAGKKMTYPTSRDTPDKWMEKTWMPAAAEVGYPVGAIPVTFIVDRKGRLAWIGHPFSPAGAFDEALEKVVNATFDVDLYRTSVQAAMEAKRSEEQQTAEKRAASLAPILQSMREAVAAKDWARVISEAHNAIAHDPRAARETFLPRYEAFKALLVADPAKAASLFELEKDLAAGLGKPKDPQLADIASVFLATAGLPRESYDFPIRALEAQDPAGIPFTRRWVRALQQGYENSGRFADGVALQKKVLGQTAVIDGMPEADVARERALLEKFTAENERRAGTPTPPADGTRLLSH